MAVLGSAKERRVAIAEDGLRVRARLEQLARYALVPALGRLDERSAAATLRTGTREALG